MAKPVLDLRKGGPVPIGTPVEPHQGVGTTKDTEIVAMFSLSILSLSLTSNRKRLALLTVLTFITLC
jgi:hypothetical protein